MPHDGARHTLTGTATRRRACFVLAFAVLVVAGRATGPEGSELAVVWPAAALAVVWTASAWGRRRDLLVDVLLLAAVAGAANAATGAPPAMCLAFAVANVAQGLVACAVFRSRRPAGFALTSLQDLGALALAAVSSSAASAAVVTVAMVVSKGADPLPVLGTLLVRNAVSTLLLVALALRLGDRSPGSRTLTTRSVVELAGISTVAAGGYLVSVATGAPFALVLTVLPLAALAAVRLPTTTAVAVAVANGVAATLVSLVSPVPLAADGTTASVLVTQAFLAVTASLTFALALYRDERSALIARLGESEQRFRLTFTTAPTGLCMVALDPGSRGVVHDANAAMTRFLGREPSELVDAPLLDHCPEPGGALLAADVARAAATGVMVPVERPFRHADGGVVWGQCAGSVVRPVGAEPYLLLLVTDVTERRGTEQALRHQAAHDGLTGLANRTLLLERLELAVSREPGVGVLYLDLDGFKAVNDLAGHATGDLLLQQVAARLLGVVRADDTVSRLGGDEFAVVCPGLDALGMSRLAERVSASVALPYALDGGLFHVTVSTGIAGSDGRASAREVLRRADDAMYVTKHRRRAQGLVEHVPVQGRQGVRAEPTSQAQPL